MRTPGVQLRICGITTIRTLRNLWSKKWSKNNGAFPRGHARQNVSAALSAPTPGERPRLYFSPRLSPTDMDETILQFGTGRFLRGFFDRFVQNAADAEHPVGKIVVVQSTGSGRADALDPEKGYRVHVRGAANGGIVDRTERVRSLSRVLVASKDWASVRDCAVSPKLRLIVSNTTEAGFATDPADRFDAEPPASFPGKLTQLLALRWRAGLPGVTVLPCELLENNAAKLRALVLAQAEAWTFGEDFADWLTDACVWLDTLVDCIVTLPSEPHPDDDAATVQAEPYALLAIAGAGPRPEIPEHPCIAYVGDLSPYYLRKVRILNGLHTAMAALYLPAGKTTVGEVMNDPACVIELEALLRNEILPVLDGRAPGADAFADAVSDRFRNPFLSHKLADIAGNHELKKAIRLRSTFDEYTARFGSEPPILKKALAVSLS